jgi:hypothetical protein
MKRLTDGQRAVKSLMWDKKVSSNQLRANVWTHKATNRLKEQIEKWGLDVIIEPLPNRCVSYYMKSTGHNKKLVKLMGI